MEMSSHSMPIAFLTTIYMLLVYAVSALITVGSWIIINKAKEEGWSIMVPLYNLYIINKIAKINLNWSIIAISLIFPYICGILGIIAGIGLTDKTYNDNMIVPLIPDGMAAQIPYIGEMILILSVLTILTISLYYVIWSIVWSLNIARHFGQSTMFAVGIIIFPMIFLPIMAFDKNIQYIDSTQKKIDYTPPTEDITVE